MKKFKRFFFPLIISICLLSIVAGSAAADPLEKKWGFIPLILNPYRSWWQISLKRATTWSGINI